jgi:hypothetical protein
VKDLLADFRQTIEVASERLLTIPEAESSRATADKWSPRQIVGHLIDSAANNHQRFVRAQFRDDLHFPGYQQNEWVEVQRYNDEPWLQLVQLWKYYNLHLLHVMSVTPEQKLSELRSIHNLDEIAWQTVDKKQPATLEYFMRDYVAHLHHHLKQILGDGIL